MFPRSVIFICPSGKEPNDNFVKGTYFKKKEKSKKKASW